MRDCGDSIYVLLKQPLQCIRNHKKLILQIHYTAAALNAVKVNRIRGAIAEIGYRAISGDVKSKFGLEQFGRRNAEAIDNGCQYKQIA